MLCRLATLTGCLLMAAAQPVAAQQDVAILATAPLRFESWHAAPLDDTGIPAAGSSITVSDRRKDKWLIGGAVGAAAGIVFCTAMSTMIDDSAKGGLSFCPLDSYLILGGAGFVLGAAIGAVF